MLNIRKTPTLLMALACLLQLGSSAQYRGGPGVGQNMVSFTFAPNAAIRLKAFLSGAYDPSIGLMNDALRGLPTFPLTEPYTLSGYTHVGGGGEVIPPMVLDLSGPDAIVDWVVLELRNISDPSTVVATRSALIQRDGDVVGLDGVSAVLFTAISGSYHVAVRHRNHLGAMTLGGVALGLTPVELDLRAIGTSTYGTDAQVEVPGAVPAMALWAGDVTFDGVLKYTGQDNDRDNILSVIGGSVPSNTMAGYLVEDVNLDGTVKYTGQDNDRDPILQNVGGIVPTDTREEQIP